MSKGGRSGRLAGARAAGGRATSAVGGPFRRVPWRAIGSKLHAAATWHLTLPIVVGVLGLSLIVTLFVVFDGSSAKQEDAGPPPPPPAVEVPVYDPEHSMAQPPKIEGEQAFTDIIVYSPEPLSDDVVEKINKLQGVKRSDLFSMGSAAIDGQVYKVAAINPATFRRFAPSWQQDEIWSRVAAGEMAVLPKVANRLQDAEQFIEIGGGDDAEKLHIGAYTPLPRTIQMAVNAKWGEDLLEVQDNAMLIWTAGVSPKEVRDAMKGLVDERTEIIATDAGAKLDLGAVQIAIPTSGSVGDAIGVYNYTVAGGRVIPSSAWVSANIRTEDVPIVGPQTCHKDMLPQLRAALTELVQRGLDKYIEFSSGCYNPRFIANSTSLSNHAFGMAIDFDAPYNGRGTAGRIPPAVVQVFKDWGFAWGGDWAWTDPMHFELVRIFKVG